MKKFFALLLSLCLIASLPCISAFATEETTTDLTGTTAPEEEATVPVPPADENPPADGVVLRIRALTKKDGEIVVDSDHKNFEDGWNAAMSLASKAKEMNAKGYAKIIVDLHADWNADDGIFSDDITNGKGFNADTICFPKNVNVILNLNGHTIDRGLTEYTTNGEVIYIDKDANVTIFNGTITGGFSGNGAGGIHVKDRANVTLNNVKVDGNAVEDDKGAAIALYGGASLTMNGGSLSHNFLKSTEASYSWLQFLYDRSEGTLYVEDSTAVLNDVTIAWNYTLDGIEVWGAAVAMKGTSEVTLSGCTVEANGLPEGKGWARASSIFYTRDSGCVLNIKDGTVIKGNSQNFWTMDTRSSSVFRINGKLNVWNSSIIGNLASVLFDMEEKESSAAVGTIKESIITQNHGYILYGDLDLREHVNTSKLTFEKCQLGQNKHHGYKNAITHYSGTEATFIDCDLGDTTWTKESIVTITDTSKDLAGSVFDEGSLPIIISLAALAVSVASLCLNIASNKKKLAPSQAPAENEE